MFGATFELEVMGFPPDSDPSTPDPFAALIAAGSANFVFLLVAHPFDADIEGVLAGLPPPVMTDAVMAGTTFTVQGTETAVYLSDVGFTTEPDESPANQHFEPRLQSPYQLRVSLFDGAEPVGQAASSRGEIVVLNGDAGLDDWPSFSWDGRQLEVLVGGPDFTFDEFGTVYLGSAEGLTHTEDTITLPLRGRDVIFDKSVHPSNYAGTGGLEGGDDLAGQPKPGAFGRVRNITPVQVDVTNQVWQVHDGRVQSIDAVRDKGVALTNDGDVADLYATTVSAGSYKTDLARGYFRLGGAPDGQITADVEGDADSSAGGYVSTIADIAKRIVTTRLGVDNLAAADLDGAFALLATDQPAVAGIYDTQGRTAREVLDELLASIGGWWGFARDGLLFVGRLEAPAAPVATLADSDVNANELEALRAIAPSWRRRVGWRRNWTVQRDQDLAGAVSAADRAFYGSEYRFATESDSTVLGRYRLARDVETRGLFDLEADAASEAERLQTLHGVARTRYRAPVSEALFRFWVEDAVTVQLDRFDLANGKAFAIVAIEEDGASHATVLELWG